MIKECKQMAAILVAMNSWIRFAYQAWWNCLVLKKTPFSVLWFSTTNGLYITMNNIKSIYTSHNVMEWQELVKVHRKDQSVKDFTSKWLFLLFWPISCISLILIFLIEIWSFCTNLLENYPSHKIDQLPLLRILSLCMDHSMQTRINCLHLFLLFLFTPLGLFGQNDVRIHVLVCTIVYSVLDQA